MTVCFFVNTKTPDVIKEIEFYKIDIQILKDMGHEIKFCFNFMKIPKDVDYYFIWWWTYALFPVFKAKRLKKKSIITGTLNFDAITKGVDFDTLPFYKKLLIKKAARNTDANIMVSQYEYKRMHSLTQNNIFYSPHVLDLKKYEQNSPPKRKKYIYTISWVSKANSDRKCIKEIIMAGAILKKKGFNIPIHIDGKIEEDGRFLIKIVQDLGLEDTIFFNGKVSEEEKIKKLNECAVYLQPSIFEGFGVAIAEAMLSGAPVISSKVGAVPEVTGDNCIYVNGKSPQDIADKIILSFSDYKKSLEIAKKGSEYIKSQFYYGRRKKDFEEIFNQIELR